jgi:dipeptidyl aminopeptidase/acylaminoacyl peptidase
MQQHFFTKEVIIMKADFRFFLIFTLALSLSPAVFAAEKCPETMDGMPLIFSDDFEDGADRWEMTDDKAWTVEEDEGDNALYLKRKSRYEPPVRSPYSIAWIKDLECGSFVLDLKLKQTGREYGHRDLCLFFNGVDPARFYYVHMATKADAHANSIFLVNNEPRVSIAKARTDGTKWTPGYHHVRVKRCAETGKIEVFFDNMDKPIMMAEDKTFTKGRIGVGSFDDVGMFDDVCIWGKKAGGEKAGEAASAAK